MSVGKLAPEQQSFDNTAEGPTLDTSIVSLPDEVQAINDLVHVKSGYKTSEFWQALVVNIASLAGAVFPNDPIIVKVAGLLIAAINTVAYIAARVAVKKHAMTLRAETVNPQIAAQNQSGGFLS